MSRRIAATSGVQLERDLKDKDSLIAIKVLNMIDMMKAYRLQDKRLT